MMGRQTGDQSQLFYVFNLEERIPDRHLLRRINPIVTGVVGKLREELKPFYSEIGRPPIDPELMLRMLIVGYGGYCPNTHDDQFADRWSAFGDGLEDPIDMSALGTTRSSRLDEGMTG